MYYSQCGEDEFLNETIFLNKKNGKYIELGALDGIQYSNTKFFEDNLGWSGVLIEPHPHAFKQLEINRPKNFLFNDLVSSCSDPLNFIYFMDFLSAVSCVASENSPSNWYLQNEDTLYRNVQRENIIIKPKSFTEIIKSTNIQHFDLLSLDVEGHEYEVLKSWDFSIPIDVILIETLGTSNDELCRELLISKNYKFIQKYKHNEVFMLIK